MCSGTPRSSARTPQIFISPADLEAEKGALTSAHTDVKAWLTELQAQQLVQAVSIFQLGGHAAQLSSTPPLPQPTVRARKPAPRQRRSPHARLPAPCSPCISKRRSRTTGCRSDQPPLACGPGARRTASRHTGIRGHGHAGCQGTQGPSPRARASSDIFDAVPAQAAPAFDTPFHDFKLHSVEPTAAGCRHRRSRRHHGQHPGRLRRSPQPHAGGPATAGHRPAGHREHGGQGLGAPDPIGAGPCGRGRRGCHLRPGLAALRAPLPAAQRPVRRCLPGRARRPAGIARTRPAAGLPDQQAAVLRPAAAGAKGLAPLFEQVFGGDSFERKKPDPLPLLKTCEALGTSPRAR